jgi:ATP-dependent Clp protease protease subunit
MSNEETGYAFVSAPPNNLAEKGIYYFSGEVNQQSAKEIITWILDENFKPNSPNYDHLTLMITSFGGDMMAAFAVIDVMRGSRIPIHTIGLGVIASAGLMMHIAGEKGHRMITPNTSILSHQWTWGAFGKEHELLATHKQFDLTTKRVLDHYKKCTGLTEKQIKSKLLPAQDVWLSSDEAIHYNLTDVVKDLK